MAIVGSCLMVFGSTALFHLMSSSRHSVSTPGSRRIPLCVNDSHCRAFRTVQETLQTATAVISSHKLVSWENGGGV